MSLCTRSATCHGTKCRVLGSLVVMAVIAASAWPSLAADQEYRALAEPFRLKTEDGTLIDCGDSWGHAGPCVEDVDGDGVRDLVVGDFSGQFRLYRNSGSNEKPQYAAGTYLQAGGESRPKCPFTDALAPVHSLWTSTAMAAGI